MENAMVQSLAAQSTFISVGQIFQPFRQRRLAGVPCPSPTKVVWTRAGRHGRRLCFTGTRQAATVADVEMSKDIREGAQDVEYLWRTLDKNLSIGKSGLQASHVNMLRDALAARHVAKVKFGLRSAMTETAERICQETNAQVLMVKGAFILFGEAGVDSSALNAKAKEFLAHKNKKAKERKKKTGKMEGVEMPVSVMARMKALADEGILSHSDFDWKARSALVSMPEVDQLEVLSGLAKKDLKGINNRSAWLTSRVKVYLNNKGSSRQK